MQVWAWQDMPGFTLPKVVDFEAKNLLAKKIKDINSFLSEKLMIKESMI